MKAALLRFLILCFWASGGTMMASSISVARKPAIAAVAQLRSTSNKWQNLLDVAKCANLAKQKGASMLFLPECFGFMGESAVQTLEQAEDLVEADSNTNIESLTEQLNAVVAGGAPAVLDIEKSSGRVFLLDGLRTIAWQSGLWISGGGMHVAGAPIDPESGNPRVYNTHVIVNDQGGIQAIYRKIHLFDVSIPGKVQLRESATTAPGTQLVVCDSPVGKLGLSTCYDMRFPEMYIPMVEAGAQILLMPSAFTVPTGAAHWHTLLESRAIEHQCYVIAAAQYGRHNEKRESFGHSLAVDPWGRVLADAGGYPLDGANNSGTETAISVDPAPSIVTCEIDLDVIDSTRERMPLHRHRQSANFSF